MSGGVTTTGFVPKTIEEIKASIEQELLATIDPALDLAPDQPMGQIVGVFSKKVAEIWEALAVAYNAFNRAAAEGALLDAIGLLTGTLREPARKGLVTCTVNLNAGTTLTAGPSTIANVFGQETNRWQLKETVGPVLTGGDYSAVFECEQTGPVACNAGTLTVITTPVGGWNSITNPDDADIGADAETDAQYRLRQTEELSAPGSCTVDAIRAELLKVDGVLEAFVYENTSMETDADGVPAKAYECVIWDGETPAADDGEIGQAIWDNKPSGIQTYGTTSVDVDDSTGETRTVYFTRATPVDIYLTYALDVDEDKYPLAGDTLVKEALVAKSLSLQIIGKSVTKLIYEAEPLTIDGVEDVTDFHLGTTPSPSGTSNIAITSRQIAVFDTSRITVVTS